MIIHVIGTVNGEVNEGMRNIATHISRAFEKEHTVIYSGLRQLPKIVFDSKKADVTFIFAWADKRIYDLVKAVSVICPAVWVVLVQKPSYEFLALAAENPLQCGYLYMFDEDVKGLTVAEGRAVRRFSVGINAEKFTPPAQADTRALKEKYGFDPDRPLVMHVGHCSGGRGLEDFLKIRGAQRLIIALNMVVVLPVSTAIYPEMSRRFEASRAEGMQFFKRVLVYAALAAAVVSLGTFVVAPFAIPIIYGGGYEPAIDVLRWLSPLPFLVMVATLLTVQGLYGLGLHRFAPYVGLILAALCISVNLWLLPSLGVKAVCIGWNVAEVMECVIVGGILMVKGRRING